MTFKRPSNLRSFRLASRDRTEQDEINQSFNETGTLQSRVRTASHSGLDNHSVSPAAAREMLEMGNYGVALISRSATRSGDGLDLEQLSVTLEAVLLPFSWKELVLGVRESVRDSNTLGESKVASFGDVHINFTKMEVRRSSSGPIALTLQEFKTLTCFVSNPARVLSRNELLNEAWGYNSYPSTRTVDNHVLKLRQKLEKDPIRPVHFHTVRGVGYKFLP